MRWLSFGPGSGRIPRLAGAGCEIHLIQECQIISGDRSGPMILALASPRVASSVVECLDNIKHSLAEAAAQGAAIVCFPEAYLPGLRGLDFEVPTFDERLEEDALHAIAQWTQAYRIAAIVGIERVTTAGRQIAAFVMDKHGQLLGLQTKNQLDPSEDRFYLPGSGRRLFAIDGMKFGIAICHEGFRYPETVRWAAVRGAQIVFHPHCTGSDHTGVRPTQWAAAGAPYY